MPNIKKKSEDNETAATLLKDNGLFCASIHCSYYSTFQLSKHVLAEHENINYRVQDASGYDSHNNVIKLMKNHFGSTQDDVKSMRRYDTLMGQLKKQRILADYKINLLGDTLANAVFDMANEAKKILKDKYQIT